MISLMALLRLIYLGLLHGQSTAPEADGQSDDQEYQRFSLTDPEFSFLCLRFLDWPDEIKLNPQSNALSIYFLFNSRLLNNPS
jgi:hypothetical protein